MNLGKYRVRDERVDDFNSRFSNYGDSLKEIIFDFKSKKIDKNEAIYRIEFYKEDLSFQDSITKSVSIEKQSWFEEFFQKIN